MTVEELKEKLDAGEAPCVLDVREARELAVAAYPFPVLHIPMAQIPARLDEIPATGPSSAPAEAAAGARTSRRSWIARPGRRQPRRWHPRVVGAHRLVDLALSDRRRFPRI